MTGRVHSFQAGKGLSAARRAYLRVLPLATPLKALTRTVSAPAPRALSAAHAQGGYRQARRG